MPDTCSHLTLSQIADRAEAIASEAADHHLRQDALALMHRADAGDPDALSPAPSSGATSGDWRSTQAPSDHGGLAMTKTAAMNQARADVYLRPQGGQYILCEHDPAVGCVREDYPREYFLARRVLTDRRVARALEAMGYPYNFAYAQSRGSSGSFRERIDSALREAAALGIQAADTVDEED